ncbi:MAG TPA: pilus assembly protein [Rhizomicrobium sp.]|nr:pilus assembly protein [Rhizomicrobium sp.]
METRLNFFVALARDFLRSKRGNVAMMFAIALVPLMIGAGAGLDFVRAMMVRQQMAEALDAAALAVGSTPGLDQATAQALAQQYFDANYTVDKTMYGTVTIQPPIYDAKGSVSLTATNSMPTVLMKLAGITDVPVSTTSTVVWGQTKLWVALVLDNSGSMCQPDPQPCFNSGNAATKIYQLKDATKKMLTSLQAVSTTPGDVRVAIVPFNSEVDVGTGLVSASWLNWSDWDAAPKDSSGVTITGSYTIPKTNLPFDAYGPHDDCPFTTTVTNPINKKSTTSEDAPFGFGCQKNPNNNSGNVAAGAGASPIPPSGLICPTANSAAYSKDHLARYYNGCWSSTQIPGATVQVSSGAGATCGGFSPVNCSCSNNVCKTQKWSHVWVPNDHASTWSGCIADREQDYDISNTSPSGSDATGFPAANSTNSVTSKECMSGKVTPLEYDWSDLAAQVKNMQAKGSTNQAIGVAHGWIMLTPNGPYGTPALPANTTRYIILFSDGLNTQNRWWGDGRTEGTPDDDKIDNRMELVCDAAKADGVVIYTLYVHTAVGAPPSPPLQNCASDASKYYNLTSSSQIAAAFADITKKITNVRVSM